MSSRSIRPSLRPAWTDSGRYQVVRELGRGGMAHVYEVADSAQGGRHVALKRLLQQADPRSQQRNAELFEREFHTLKQLAHPRVVQAFEFGIDDAGPHYTMELLDGGDLHQLAPLPWREATAIGRDLCSALSVLHSRRLVHRDVSPRNVRRASEGQAKLLDFGALAPFGTSKIVVGTPPCCPPESIQLRPLDGRTDLYALGATLYYLLVGRHAYDARQIHELTSVWRDGFTRAADLVEDIPLELDVLLLELLSLDADARPANAAEVIQRLTAIDAGTHDDLLQVVSAYLSTPTLVGREEPLARVKHELSQPERSRGTSLRIEGPPGVGRSRFLDACLLDASLRGSTVLRADADDAASGPYGVVRTLGRQLLAVLPQISRAAAEPALSVLATLLPELGVPAPEPPAEPQLRGAVREWLYAVGRARSLVIGLDDFDRFDDASASVLALAALEQPEPTLAFLFTIESSTATLTSTARKLLVHATESIVLENLHPRDTRRLLAAVFGSAPNLDLLSERAHELCNGNPRDLLRLSQHFVDRRVVRYEAGAWTLPAQLDAAELPSSIAAALQARIAAQSESARQIAYALALCPDATFDFDECKVLAEGVRAAVLRDDVDALIRAEIAREREGKLSLTHPSWIPLLRAAVPHEVELDLHGRLAKVLAQRSDHEFIMARHLLRSREPSRALDVLVRHAEQATANAAPLAISTVTAFFTPVRDWAETYDRALALCDELHRPVRDKFALWVRMTALCAILGHYDDVQLPRFLAALARWSGLEDFESLPKELPAEVRVKRALEAARHRYDALPEHERALDPGEAIRQLVRTVSVVTGIAAAAFDLAYLRAAPDLTPFTGLARVLGTIEKLVHGMEQRLTGSVEHAAEQYRELLELLESPDRGGYEAINADYTRAGILMALGLLEAGRGLPSCALKVEQLRELPAFEANALMLRTVHLLFQGDAIGAEQQRERAARLRLQNGARPIYGSGHLLWELQAFALSEDLTRIRHTVEELTPLAKIYPGWKPILLYGLAEYHRICRNARQALTELETALRLAPPGSHQVWPSLAACHVLVLLDLEQYAEAHASAQAARAAAESALREQPPMLVLAAALAEAHAARAGLDGASIARAAQIADEVIAAERAAGVRGIRLGVGHELRARISLLAEDELAFHDHAELCREIYCAYGNPALLAKSQRLMQSAARAQGPARPRSERPAEPISEAQLRAALERCRTRDERVQLALAMLLERGGASAGSLFVLGSEGLECAASIRDTDVGARLLARAQRYLDEQVENIIDARTADLHAEVALHWTDESGQRYAPFLLAHSDGKTYLISGVVACALPARERLWIPGQLLAAASRVLVETRDSAFIVVAE